LSALTEHARAKVNLSLEVLGRRDDGYHELASLVAFASVADVISLTPGAPLGIEIEGPWAHALSGEENLVLRAAHTAQRQLPDLRLGHFRLEKHLPVAAGIGGGSADAAAALRLLRAANPDLSASLDWSRLALSIGADVPVCLHNAAAFMSGIGERIAPVASMPPLWAVLVNPRVPLSTADVFRSLNAPPTDRRATQLPEPPAFEAFAHLIDWLAGRPNGLEISARALCPAITPVLQELTLLPESAMARMSGSGPTCFALFAESEAADSAARSLATRHPEWWVCAAHLA